MASVFGAILVVPSVSWSLTTQDKVLSSSSLLISKSQPEQEGLVSTTRVAALLRVIPTFTIVDQKGVPYMVVGEDAKVTGYFFTEYKEARRILNLASRSADKAIAAAANDPQQQPYLSDLKNPWKEARISSVPLDLAVTLVSKSNSMSIRRSGGSYFQIAPSEADIEDAVAITGLDGLAEGKVPLFYYEDFVLVKDDVKECPLYFRRSDLEKAYKKAHPGEALPKASVSELFAVLTEMVKPGGTDEELKTLVFVPPEGSLAKAQQCARKGGKEAAFLVGQRNVIL